MTEQELVELEGEFGWTADYAAGLMPRLVAEVRRLRGLVERAVPCEHCCPHCPWCASEEIYLKGESWLSHAADCRAFNPDGSVK